MKFLVFGGAAIAIVVYIVMRPVPAKDFAVDDQGTEYDYTPGHDDTPQMTTIADDIAITLDPSTYTPAAVNVDQATQNEAAFLDMLAFAEGVAPGADGYRTLFGGQLFYNDFADHPRIAKQFTDRAGRKLWTSAAGRYQFMAASPIPTGGATRVDTWGALQRRLDLSDFSPANQDRAALELVRERGALADVQAGRLDQAIAKCAQVWASLPGAGYAQKEQKFSKLLSAFVDAGGTTEA